MVNFLTSAGRDVDAPGIKRSLGTQINEQRLMIGRYNKELKVYADEMVRARDVFGENSIEYREAQTKYEEINKSLIEASTQFNELNQQLYELDLTKLEYAMDKLEAVRTITACLLKSPLKRTTNFLSVKQIIISKLQPIMI